MLDNMHNYNKEVQLRYLFQLLLYKTEHHIDIYNYRDHAVQKCLHVTHCGSVTLWFTCHLLHSLKVYTTNIDIAVLHTLDWSDWEWFQLGPENLYGFNRI